MSDRDTDTDGDADSMSIKLQLLGFFVAVMLAVAVFMGIGLDVFILHAIDESSNNTEPATLDQYAAVNSIEYENQSVMIHLAEEPMLEGDGFRGHDVTELQLTRNDGQVSERISHQTGVQQYQFSIPNQTDGKYTLTLINYHPTDPGLFGSPERYDKQSFTFEITNGNMTNLTVPEEAKYY